MLQFATRHPEKVFAERQGDFGGSLTFFCHTSRLPGSSVNFAAWLAD